MKKENKYLVDTCKGTKYYVTMVAAIKEYLGNKQAHTIAEKIN